jgi:hopanoid biosynthesis associated RND transporter like protein HpnN
MIANFVTRLVDLCIRRAWWALVLALILGVGGGFYVGRHFAISTDVNKLLSSDLPWKKQAAQYAAAFPERGLVVVLEAPTPELADDAASRLSEALKARRDLFAAVNQPGGDSFFARNGLLFLPTEDLSQVTQGLKRARIVIARLAADPSLRGVLGALSLAIDGVEFGQIKLDDLSPVMNAASDTLSDVLANRPASFSWLALASGKPSQQRDLTRFIEIAPVLNFRALQPGRVATDAIKQIASDLHLKSDDLVQIHITGPVAINDAEFATIDYNAVPDAFVALVAVTVLLWLALRSLRLMVAVLLSVAVGLAVSTAAGLLLVGALNLISVAFFALFIGLSVDFAIQFSVRYRAERSKYHDLPVALRSAATIAGRPLTLAAAATAVGFMSFLPTSYRGLSELGQIAGTGMIVAFIISITFLPALLFRLKPPGEPHPIGFKFLAPLDWFLLRYRVPIVLATVLVVGLAAPSLRSLPYDFNPIHLLSAKTDSVATYLRLRKNPEIGANAIDIVAPDLDAAKALAQRLASLPEVAHTETLSDFVPVDQDQKLKLIHEAAAALDPALNPRKLQPPPSEKQNIDAMSAMADRLVKIADNGFGPGPEAARRLSSLLGQLAKADATARQRANDAFIFPLLLSFDQLREELKAEQFSIYSLPTDIVRQWQTADGRARIKVLPKGDAGYPRSLHTFVRAVSRLAPGATGPAVSLYESANTVLQSFVEAGVFAFCVIAILLYVVLGRIGDVFLTLVPLLIAGVVTLELCTFFDLPLNFANIIALPLLLGVGVAFKIYYVEAWRAGKTNLLQSSLTRAIIFSAMTTGTAFGSLWLSDNPGLSSMGRMMALALVCTLAAAVLFQQALLGPPRSKPRDYTS